jgi:pyrroline-5-carboxylate reductase
MPEIGRVGIVGGAGWLGTAIARALVARGTVAPERLTCSYRSAKPASPLDCAWTRDNARLVAQSDVVILSVRPGDWKSVEIDAAGKLVISVMAGVTVEDIAGRTGSSRVARALPNAAAEIGYAYTPYFLASSEPRDGGIVASLFRSCGEVDAVSSEAQIDYLAAMSGSGAAYPALLAEAMMRDAIGRGLPPDLARRAAEQVIVGAGRLQEWSGASPTETVSSFLDYQGMTAAGIAAMREQGFDRAVGAGLDAALRKVRALSSG